MRLTKRMLNPAIRIVDGNTKLANNDGENFLTWSIPAVSTCPWRTALCEKYCYAKRDERYPSVVKSRNSNLDVSKSANFVEDMKLALQWQLGRKKNAGKQLYFRIHVSGDFYNLAYLQAWYDIAAATPEIEFTAYTKSVLLVDGLPSSARPHNLKLIYSVWDDTKWEDINLARWNNMPTFEAVRKDELEARRAAGNQFECKMSCKECKTCYTSSFKLDTFIEIH